MGVAMNAAASVLGPVSAMVIASAILTHHYAGMRRSGPVPTSQGRVSSDLRTSIRTVSLRSKRFFFVLTLPFKAYFPEE